jgi:hypothetical protein
MRRRYDRLEKAYAQRTPDFQWADQDPERVLKVEEFSDESLIDDALAFFESCLHLRDWIAHDETLPRHIGEAAFSHVKSSRALRLCHDVAIGSKHLNITRPLAKDENPRLHRELAVDELPYSLVSGDDAIPDGYTVQFISVNVVLATDGAETVDALVFARECLAEWDAFFKLHGLTT